jgi:mono/diheme cytochrome c family protein
MRGQIVVRPALPASDRPGEYWKEPEPEGVRLVDRGAWLLRQNGCFTCHGEDGHGGVRNPNYINDEVPALDVLAERMFLYYPEDVDAIVQALERRTPLQLLANEPPVPGFSRVLAKYNSVKELLQKGNPPGKKDEHGPAPPLQMPSWESRLSDSDIDAVIAYLLTLKPLETGAPR